MNVLPASVRVALWSTAALAGRLDPDEIPARALGDLDHCSGLVETVELWRGLGERVVLPALPRPGNTTGMPTGAPELVDAATRAGELIYVPGIGGACVPRIEQFGPDGDQGWQALWQRFDADPVPVHRLEALDLSTIEVHLRTQIARRTSALESTDAPLVGRALTEVESTARRALTTQWGLPEGVPHRAVRLITLCGRLAAVADAGADARLQSTSAAATTQREMVLRDIGGIATSGLAEAAALACLSLARETN